MRVEIKSFKIFFIHTVSKTVEYTFCCCIPSTYNSKPVNCQVYAHSWNSSATLPDVFNSCHALRVNTGANIASSLALSCRREQDLRSSTPQKSLVAVFSSSLTFRGALLPLYYLFVSHSLPSQTVPTTLKIRQATRRPGWTLSTSGCHNQAPPTHTNRTPLVSYTPTHLLCTCTRNNTTAFF